MSEYSLVPLHKCLQPLVTGKRPRGGVKANSEGIPSLGGENIKQNGGVKYDGVKRVPVDFFHTMKSGHLVDRDVLINKDGANTGKVGLYSNKHFHHACINEHLFLMRGESGVIEQEFLYYTVLSGSFQRELKGKITGSAQPGLNSNFINNFPIFLPPIKSQQEIASILTSVDYVIEKKESQVGKLKDLKKGMMQELLTKGIGHTELKDSPVGRIPKEWEVKSLGEISQLQRGHDITKSKMVDGEYPVVSSSGISGYHNKHTTEGPGVVVGRKGTIGSVHYLESNYWAHDTSLYVTDFFNNSIKYVYYLLVSLDLEKYGTKSGSPSLNRNDIHPLKLAIPKRQEQQQIANILTNTDNRIGLIKKQLEGVQNLKKALMQDLLTGKVRVKTD